MVRSILFSLLIIVFFVSCNKYECSYNGCGKVAPAAEIQNVETYLASQNITNAVKHCSGLYYVIDNAGSGTNPDACSDVDVTYVGRLTNGSTFDQGQVQFNLANVIAGWRNAIPLIAPGGKIRLYIPPSLGYGPEPYGPIPGNSILVFTVDLNAVL